MKYETFLQNHSKNYIKVIQYVYIRLLKPYQQMSYFRIVLDGKCKVNLETDSKKVPNRK